MQYTVTCDIPGRLRVRFGRYVLSRERCAAVEEYLGAIPGVLSAKAGSSTGSVLVLYCGDIRDRLLRLLSKMDFRALPEPSETLVEQKNIDAEFVADLSWRVFKRYVIRPFLPIPVRRIRNIVNSLSYFREGAGSLLHGKINTSVLDASAIGAAYYQQDFKTASSVMFLLGVSDSLEEYTRKRTHNALVQSLAVNVDRVWKVLESGEEFLVPAEQVLPGDTVVIRTGTLIPVDGTVVRGEALVNESSMTGEPLAVMRACGASVYAGTVVEEGELYITVRELARNSRINKIVGMIEDSEQFKAGIQSQAERFADAVVPYSFLGALGVFAVTGNVSRALSVLMVDYSCALKLSTPISVISAMKEAADSRILVKGGKFLEEFACADTVVFDKTGTLTVAKPRVVDVIAFKQYDRTYVLQNAACLEEHFPHSVARAVVRKAEEEHLVHPEVHAHVECVVAHGIASSLNGERMLIGSAHFIFEDEGVPVSAEEMARIEAAASSGCSVIFMAVSGELAGAICIEDTIRHEAADVLSALRDAGLSHLVMLTGDGEAAARSVSSRLGIDQYYAQVLPEDKAAIITRMKEEGRRVIMIGDGVNDTPGLAAANVSVAMKDASDIAQGVADITLLSADLRDLLMLRELSCRLMTRVQKNYQFIIGFNTALLVLGQMGMLSPGMSALLHNTSTMGISAASMQPLLPGACG